MRNSLGLPLILFTSIAVHSENNSSVIAFKNADVISMQSETVQNNYTVLIQNGQIVSVGPANQVKVPQSATSIDARGKHLIPGLVDAHAHVSFPDDLVLYIAAEAMLKELQTSK
jgi:imidazolonepropionase-like amidohydrolase